MRNLSEYPLTEAEIVSMLDRLVDGLRSEERLGDVRPVVLATVARIVKSIGDAHRSAPQGQPVDAAVARLLQGAGELAHTIRWTDKQS